MSSFYQGVLMYENLRKQFMDADTNNSGFLDLAQFHQIVRSDFDLSTEIVSTMLAAIDGNSDGRINYLEFLDAMHEAEDTEDCYELPEIDDVTAEISKFNLREETEETEDMYELPEVENVTEELQKLKAFFSK